MKDFSDFNFRHKYEGSGNGRNREMEFLLYLILFSKPNYILNYNGAYLMFYKRFSILALLLSQLEPFLMTMSKNYHLSHHVRFSPCIGVKN
jgi:hypothetical protein